MEAVRALAETVERAFRAADYDHRVFHQIAAEALWAAGPVVSLADILDHVFTDALWPVPLNRGAFGQPPVPLLTTPHFYVEALLWLQGSTSIHQHGFEGAFTLIEGESIATDWRFLEEERVGSHLVLGRLEPTGPSRLLRPGVVTPIPAGARFIHTVFHRIQPTVTLIVRTAEDPLEKLPFAYTRTGLALDPFPADPRSETRRQTLSFLRVTDEPAFVARLFDALETAPLWESARLLERYADPLREEGVLGAALEAVHRKHGTRRTHAMARLLEESAWARQATAWAHASEGHSQLCAQAALTCASLEDAVQLVAQAYPGSEASSRSWFGAPGRCPPSWC